jgi:uncharacterized protein
VAEKDIVEFILGGIKFEYDKQKNQSNIEKHGISFQSAARVFFDYDRIEYYDEKHSTDEDRYDTIGDVSAGDSPKVAVGNVSQIIGFRSQILFVAYTERTKIDSAGKREEAIRLISARMATNFERRLYYGELYFLD